MYFNRAYKKCRRHYEGGCYLVFLRKTFFHLFYFFGSSRSFNKFPKYKREASSQKKVSLKLIDWMGSVRRAGRYTFEEASRVISSFTRPYLQHRSNLASISVPRQKPDIQEREPCKISIISLVRRKNAAILSTAIRADPETSPAVITLLVVPDAFVKIAEKRSS